LARQYFLRSWLAAALSVMAIALAGPLTMGPTPAGAAEQRFFVIMVSDAGFDPSVVADVNVGDVLIFTLDNTTDQHKVIFEDNSVCPGSRGAVPCWPELRFDDADTANCWNGQFFERDSRCMIVQDPGKTVRYHDGFKDSNGGEIRVLGQATTTTGPATTTSTAPATTTTPPPTTATTGAQTTSTTAPTAIRPFVIPDPPATSTTARPAPVAVTNNGGTTASANKDKDKDKGKAKTKAAGTETPTTASPTLPDAMPPDTVFDPAALTPGPVLVPAVPGGPDADDVNLESAAVMNLLDRDEPADDRPMLLALAALAFLLSVGGAWAWLHRASRYDPA
jgi:hypothetical protein